MQKTEPILTHGTFSELLRGGSFRFISRQEWWCSAQRVIEEKNKTMHKDLQTKMGGGDLTQASPPGEPVALGDRRGDRTGRE